MADEFTIGVVSADYADHNNDINAARRMASTKVAAWIGEGMK